MDSTFLPISASTFAEFVTARSTARLQVVRSAIETYGSDYDPRTDFYKKIRDGLRESVAEKRDDPVLKAATRASARKRPHYRTLADGWVGWSPRTQARPAAISGTWEHDGVVLKVRPLLTVSIDRELLLYLKAPELRDEGAQALTRIMELALPDVSVRTAVLDVRRRRLIKARRRRDRDYDIVIRTEAELFKSMFTQMSSAA